MKSYFSATQIYDESTSAATRQIEVDCNNDLAWSCRVNGNFALNVYQGVGCYDGDQLQIICFDDENRTAFGEIIFSYHDNGCLETFTIPIFYSETDAWLSVFPTTEVYSRSLTNEYKVFTLKTNIALNDIDVSLPNDDNYESFITKGNKLYLIKKTAIDVTVKLHASVSVNNDTTKGVITIIEYMS